MWVNCVLFYTISVFFDKIKCYIYCNKTKSHDLRWILHSRIDSSQYKSPVIDFKLKQTANKRDVYHFTPATCKFLIFNRNSWIVIWNISRFQISIESNYSWKFLLTVLQFSEFSYSWIICNSKYPWNPYFYRIQPQLPVSAIFYKFILSQSQSQNV